MFKLALRRAETASCLSFGFVASSLYFEAFSKPSRLVKFLKVEKKKLPQKIGGELTIGDGYRDSSNLKKRDRVVVPADLEKIKHHYFGILENSSCPDDQKLAKQQLGLISKL
jgi:hypothetical protein